jgi:hypothetical protein
MEGGKAGENTAMKSILMDDGGGVFTPGRGGA